MVTAFAHGAMGRRIDPSLSYFSFQPGIIKAVVCVILYVGVMHIKEPLLLIGKRSPCGGSGFPLSI